MFKFCWYEIKFIAFSYDSDVLRAKFTSMINNATMQNHMENPASSYYPVLVVFFNFIILIHTEENTEKIRYKKQQKVC